MMNDLTRLTLMEAALLIGKRQLSSRELTEACLSRIQRLEPSLNAFITVTAEEALSAAIRADEAAARGESLGLLHGVPIALKDLFETKGVRTTAGSRVLAEHIPSEDAAAVKLLREAGSIALGKTGLHEFAFGATGVNPHYGPVRNPWDTARIAGGSSSGSAAAVAAGECLAALGTDTGGSIRIPAALCGVVGLKPTYDRVSRRGVIPLSWSLDHVGPIARTVADAALLLEAIANGDKSDHSPATQPASAYLRGLEERQDLKGLRIGRPREHFFESIDGEVLRAVASAIDELEEMGADVREVSLPHIAEIPSALAAIQVPEALAYHQSWLEERPQDYGQDVRQRLEGGARFSAVQYVQAQCLREQAVSEWREQVFDKVDILVTPATPMVAVPIDEADLSTTIELVRLTKIFNFTGIPAVSLPCGFTASGLPIGLQLAAPRFQDAELLRVAHLYEQATEWHKRRPPILEG